MKPLVTVFFAYLASLFRSKASIQLELIALRHQLTVYQRTIKRPKTRPGDRMFWSWLSRNWPSWRDSLIFVKPETVVAWQRKRFRDHWAKLSKRGSHPGRPAVSNEIKALIRQMSEANLGWGSPRIVGELRKLGINVSKSTVEKYRVKHEKPPSQTWKAFLKNHINDLVSIDFLVVPTVRFEIVYVLVMLEHSRRRVVHFNATKHPTAQWTAQQITEAFPWDTAPKYLLRDRDSIYGIEFQKRVQTLGITEVITAPRSPWQNAYVERMIGTIRRDCLDHVVVLNERHLKRILNGYFSYYHRWRTHLSLEMDTPESRQVQPPGEGKVIQFPEVGGLHHHYERIAA